jgi:hypothetical protein
MGMESNNATNFLGMAYFIKRGFLTVTRSQAGELKKNSAGDNPGQR